MAQIEIYTKAKIDELLANVPSDYVVHNTTDYRDMYDSSTNLTTYEMLVYIKLNTTFIECHIPKGTSISTEFVLPTIIANPVAFVDGKLRIYDSYYDMTPPHLTSITIYGKWFTVDLSNSTVTKETITTPCTCYTNFTDFMNSTGFSAIVFYR